MKTSRHTPTAPELRRYFEQTGFVLAHRCAPTGTPEAWWLSDVDGTPYPMPSHWRASSLPEGNVVQEVEEFPSLPRLWRAWATTLRRFSREAECIELIRQRMTTATGAERREVVRWVRSAGLALAREGGPGAPRVDIDGVAVDETLWPWSAVAWEDGEMTGTGWPWAVTPERVADGLEIQKHPGWAEQGVLLHWFDTRYPESYFEAVKAMLVDVLPQLSGNRLDGEPGERSADGQGDEQEEAHWVTVGNEDGTPPSLH